MKHSSKDLHFCKAVAIFSCVDAFAEEMKAKLIDKLTKGYSGWDDPEWSSEQIKKTLKEHLDKSNSDMVDVANFAMFLWNRQEN